MRRSSPREALRSQPRRAASTAPRAASLSSSLGHKQARPAWQPCVAVSLHRPSWPCFTRCLSCLGLARSAWCGGTKTCNDTGGYPQAAAPQQVPYGQQAPFGQQPPYGQPAGSQSLGLPNGAYEGAQAGQQSQQQQSAAAAYAASQPYNQQGLTAVQQAQSLLASLQALQPQQPAQPQGAAYTQASQGYG